MWGDENPEVRNVVSLPLEIKTPRLLLRPHRFSDVEDVLSYANDEEWSRYLPVVHPYGRPDAEQFIARAILADREQRPQWAVVLGDTVIGGVNVRLDLENRVAELGWSIARGHWGRGYATEAARAVIDAAFATYPELNRVRAHAEARNAASLRVMEKLGMQREGCLRQNRVLKGGFFDEVWYGMLRSEWEGRR